MHFTRTRIWHTSHDWLFIHDKHRGSTILYAERREEFISSKTRTYSWIKKTSANAYCIVALASLHLHRCAEQYAYCIVLAPLGRAIFVSHGWTCTVAQSNMHIALAPMHRAIMSFRDLYFLGVSRIILYFIVHVATLVVISAPTNDL